MNYLTFPARKHAVSNTEVLTSLGVTMSLVSKPVCRTTFTWVVPSVPNIHITRHFRGDILQVVASILKTKLRITKNTQKDMKQKKTKKLNFSQAS